MDVVKDKEFILEFLREKLPFLTSNYHVEEIGLFGSFAHDEHEIESDIDILVTFKKKGKTFRNYMGLKFYLEDNLSRKVDLVTKTGLKSIIKERIEKETIYA